MPEQVIRNTRHHEHILAEDIWVRDFTKKKLPYDINNLYPQSDRQIVLNNEVYNMRQGIGNIDQEKVGQPKIIIVSDGYDFEQDHLMLSELPSDVMIMAVNRALAKWELVGPKVDPEKKRAISYFVVNNPYPECDAQFPRRTQKRTAYFPKMIASSRTSHSFVERYRGPKFLYHPTRDRHYSGARRKKPIYTIDDYRNVVCAAIQLAFHFGVEQLMLFCCDNSFNKKKDAATLLSNELYAYPQQIKAEKVIDANLHWLVKSDVMIANYSKGIELDNAESVSRDQVIRFFEDE